MLRYWNEGVCLVADLRPDLFSCPITLKLQPGAIQDIAPCKKIGRVIGQADKFGNIVQSASEASTELMERWTGSSCALLNGVGGTSYKLQSYSSDYHTNKVLTVSPPVPPGEDVYLQVNCVRDPEPACGDEEIDSLDCGHRAAVTQWVIARAYASAEPGSTEAGLSRQAFQMFFQLLNVKMRADLMYSLGVVPVNSKQLLDTRTR